MKYIPIIALIAIVSLSFFINKIYAGINLLTGLVFITGIHTYIKTLLFPKNIPIELNNSKDDPDTEIGVITIVPIVPNVPNVPNGPNGNNGNNGNNGLNVIVNNSYNEDNGYNEDNQFQESQTENTQTNEIIQTDSIFSRGILQEKSYALEIITEKSDE